MDSVTIQNAGIVSESVEGENIAGRDVNIYETYINETDSDFAAINLSAYSRERHLSPVFTGMLAEQAKDRRLLVIGGGAGFDKSAFARHLAACIAEDLPGIIAREWRDPEDVRNFTKAIREEETPAIFILNGSAPQHAGYDLKQLASVAGRHVVLLTTEMSCEAWQLPAKVAELYWFEVPVTGLYRKEELTALFLQKLESRRARLGIPAGTEIHPGTPIPGNYTPAGIASVFEAPNQFDFFFTLLETEVAETIELKIRNTLAALTDKSETLVTKWYRTLSPTEKLVALGAAMLDGLFDDQFFAVMQKVVEASWHYRDKQLQSLDYCDLDFLLGFFKFEEYDDGRLVLVSKFDNQRAEIIRAAWGGHKRHILSAFSVLTTLAGSSSMSAARRVADRDIAGTVERGKRLRAVAAETISDIGIVSPQAAEPKLLELAAASDITTRRVTAKAISRWRAFRKEDQMFSTLSRWKAARSSAIRSTAILALQYAAEYDSPGSLDSRIMELLNEMADDDGILTAMKEILPRLIEGHLPQIRNDIAYYFAVHEKYADTLAVTLTALYRSHPERLKALLEEWLESCLGESSKDNRRRKLTYRDNLLALVLRVYRSIPYTGENDVIPVSHVWNIVHRLHDQEQRSAMRAFVLETATYLICCQPEHALEHIRPIYLRTGIQDRMQFISSFGRLYLHQRSLLEGGEYRTEKDGVTYPLWAVQKRPLTVIEQILFGWLQGSDDFAREIATLAFVEFSRVFDYEEPFLLRGAVNDAAQARYAQAARMQHQQQAAPVQAPVQFPVMPHLSLWSRIKIFFWLFFRSDQEKYVLKDIMRILMSYRQTNPGYLGPVIQRWSLHSQERVRRMAWWLRKLMGI